MRVLPHFPIHRGHGVQTVVHVLRGLAVNFIQQVGRAAHLMVQDSNLSPNLADLLFHSGREVGEGDGLVPQNGRRQTIEALLERRVQVPRVRGQLVINFAHDLLDAIFEATLGVQHAVARVEENALHVGNSLQLARKVLIFLLHFVREGVDGGRGEEDFLGQGALSSGDGLLNGGQSVAQTGGRVGVKLRSQGLETSLRVFIQSGQQTF